MKSENKRLDNDPTRDEKLLLRPNLNNLLTQKQTSELLRVTEETLRNWRKKGLIKSIKFGGRRMYHIQFLNEFLNIN